MIAATGGWLFNDDSMETLFHCSANLCHHSISDLASSFSRIKWSSCLALVETSISLRKKARPTLTALQAWLRRPKSDNNSCFLHALLVHQVLNWALRSRSLSAGSLMVPSFESNSIPKKQMAAAGPTVLDGSIGKQLSCIRLACSTCYYHIPEIHQDQA